MNPTIVCPECQKEISIDEAFSHKLSAKIREQLEKQQEEKLEEEKRRLWKIAQEKAEEKVKEKSLEQQKSFQEELIKKDEELKKMREEEVKLRKEKEFMREEKEKWQLEKMRQLDEEREKIKQRTAESILEEHRMRDLEKNKQMEDMRRKIDELQMKVNLTSQQLQGEVLELELEELLKREFPFDNIFPVAKGVRGADVLQVIHDSSGRECGKIIWESKRTKNWTEEWVGKLKEDMRSAKADLAILVTTAMPEGVKNFSFKNGIYVTSFECLVNIANILRMHLISISSTKLLSEGKNERIESLYRYITSSEFAQKIDSMMETYTTMQTTLEKEKNALMRIWSQREKEIETLKNNTLMIHGSLTGLLGEGMKEVDSLGFPEVEEQAPLFTDGKIIES